ncbi:Soluble quinoprotein glucose dehydrogenase [Venustampulla echinocandica]|uniref:Soluble quinoprotein glucose dehydrogenase n=1 Tax=Venustampulla echinocandica TaxID=2656787 RepID=A0A370TT30_9HELO|nr:Soluble quinoprotein glucose dehydrogenase [Venustampulla echinocandica]RDL38689.1 Soluble quinoprotein glucose dehydrogenase [Venustampulla echinocandica]
MASISKCIGSALTGLAALALLFQPLALGQNCNLNSQTQAVFAPGYGAKLIMNGLKTPRHMVFDTLGNLLVVEQSGGGVRQIKLTDNNGVPCVASSKQIIADSSLNHGIALSPDGKTLYVSSLPQLAQWDYDAASGTTSNKKVLVTGMTNGGGHRTRTLHIPSRFPDLILMQRGSDGNVDVGTKQKSSGRSMIKIFNRAEIAQKAVDYSSTSSGTILGWGLRNAVAVGEHPITGEIWSVDQGEDDIKRNGKDVHTNNPGEKMNFHGKVNDTSAPEFGANYGYPECVPALDPSVLDIPGIKVGDLFWVEGNSQTTTQDQACKQRNPPRLVFPAHNSPMDIKFKADGSAAYLTWHGSWDRQPSDGYRVDRVEFGSDGQPKEPLTNPMPATHIMQNTNAANCQSGCFRPCGLAFDSKERLFMTSDSTGELYVLTGT